MTVRQYTLRFPPLSRGFHLITHEVEQHIKNVIQTGTLHLFLQHTSASLTINEDADPTVRSDAQRFLNDLIPQSYEKFQHTYEGSDDMPAHLKSILLGCELTLPVTQGRLNLGSWQGIYLGEHRDHASARTLILTLQGV